uniref:Uncharacterized protein n=1 Tax=Geospiza parvula TaxID=87175 RepID=A0A8C3MN31_GEOPR
GQNKALDPNPPSELTPFLHHRTSRPAILVIIPIHLTCRTCACPAVVITLVFLTLLTVLVVIGIYLYRNQGSYLTYEQPEPDTAPREEPPAKDKEEYFI